MPQVKIRCSNSVISENKKEMVNSIRELISFALNMYKELVFQEVERCGNASVMWLKL